MSEVIDLNAYHSRTITDRTVVARDDYKMIDNNKTRNNKTILTMKYRNQLFIKYSKLYFVRCAAIVNIENYFSIL